MQTFSEGVFLLKPSSSRRLAAIAIEINPVDPAESATEKRGIVLRSASELDEFNRILANQKPYKNKEKNTKLQPNENSW